MNSYSLRKNFTAIFQEGFRTILGKLAFKTKETHWIDTQDPVIALVSIHSGFHKFIDGDLKMNAFMSTIKSSVKGRITVLLSDRAHFKTFSLKYQNNPNQAFEDCLLNAQQLKARYASYFDHCQVVYWHAYICQDKSFLPSQKFVQELFRIDPVFCEFVLKDAEIAYTKEREQEFANKERFITTTIEDILEQCACLLVLSEKGYRFQFYPGNSCLSTEYLNEKFIAEGKKVNWINVFLSIESKKIKPLVL